MSRRSIRRAAEHVRGGADNPSPHGRHGYNSPRSIPGRAAMAKTFRVACVQNCAERDMAPSIAALEPLIRGAAGDGAQLIVLPELVTMLEPQNPKVLREGRSGGGRSGPASFRALAQETGAWILVGSLLIKLPGENRVANRSYLVDPTAPSPRAMTSCICSTSIWRPARPTGNRPRSRPGRARWWRPHPGGRSA